MRDSPKDTLTTDDTTPHGGDSNASPPRSRSDAPTEVILPKPSPHTLVSTEGDLASARPLDDEHVGPFYTAQVAGAQLATARSAEPRMVPPLTDPKQEPARAARGTTDLGLLLLRVAVGALIGAHGLQKLFGWWGGPGMDGFESLLSGGGYEHAKILSIVGAVTEVGAGALLILGFLTPLAAAAVLGTMMNAWLLRQSMEPGFQFFAPNGIEYESLLSVAAAAIIFSGPGRIGLDFSRGWATRPFIGSVGAFILGAGSGVAVWVLLNGANPL